jgi:hypothetical protein
MDPPGRKAMPQGLERPEAIISALRGVFPSVATQHCALWAGDCIAQKRLANIKNAPTLLPMLLFLTASEGREFGSNRPMWSMVLVMSINSPVLGARQRRSEHNLIMHNARCEANQATVIET